MADGSLKVALISEVFVEPSDPKLHDLLAQASAQGAELAVLPEIPLNPWSAATKANSGGPLLDSRGLLIGVNSAIYSPSGASAGIGFAVPVDTVRRLVPQLVEHGHRIQPGIGIVPLADAIAARYELAGVVIREVLAGTPAARAGLQGIRVRREPRERRVILGDQLVSVDGQEVASVDDLLHAFERAGVGKRVTLGVVRNAKRREVKLKLVALE